VPGASTLTAPPATTAGIDRWLRAPAPPQRLAMVRILVSVYAVVWTLGALPGLIGLVDADPARWDPVGVLAWFDSPPGAGAFYAVVVLTLAAGIAFAAGVLARISGPVLAVAFLVLTTYRNSWGQIFHTENLVALHLLILAAAPVADAWAWDARRREAPTSTEPQARYGWPLRLMSVVTVLAYVLAGWAKLRTSGTDWITGTVLRDQVAQDNLLKELFGSPSSPIAGPLLRHAWLFPPMAAFAVAVELGAPVALLGGRWRDAWVAAAWVFHLGILVLMTTLFPYYLSGVAYASMFRVERLGYRARSWRPGRALARWRTLTR
jgi:uncharacterized membrane protein YphA (DoxX/SURF4 family)